MATRADSLEDLRIAKMILQIAKDNDYHKVVLYLEHNVRKAQDAVDAHDKFSPSKMLNDFFEVVAPRSPTDKPVLPFTMDQRTVSLPGTVVVDYHEPHYV
jgi:hypothetical protein